MCQSFRYTCIQPTTFTILLIFKKQIQYFCLKLEIKSLTVAKILSLVVCLYSARIWISISIHQKKRPFYINLVTNILFWKMKDMTQSSVQLLSLVRQSCVQEQYSVVLWWSSRQLVQLSALPVSQTYNNISVKCCYKHTSSLVLSWAAFVNQFSVATPDRMSHSC